MMQWISRPMAFATKQRDRYGDAFTANIDGQPWVMLPAAVVSAQIVAVSAAAIHSIPALIVVAIFFAFAGVAVVAEAAGGREHGHESAARRHAVPSAR